MFLFRFVRIGLKVDLLEYYKKLSEFIRENSILGKLIIFC